MRYLTPRHDRNYNRHEKYSDKINTYIYVYIYIISIHTYIYLAEKKTRLLLKVLYKMLKK